MKKHFTCGVLVLLFMAFSVGVVGTYAAPEGTAAVSPEAATATPQPTPPPNEIASIGDLQAKASYSDNGRFEENMAINIKLIQSAEETARYVSAIRTVEQERDIFSVFEMSMQKNGREIPLTKTLNIRILQNQDFSGYDFISVIRIDGSGFARLLDSETKNNEIHFTASELGVFALVGTPLSPTASSNRTPAPNYAAATLQNGETAGIITSLPPNGTAQAAEGDGVVTPGAFVFWLILALVIGVWAGIGIGYALWGRYKTKKVQRGPHVIGE